MSLNKIMLIGEAWGEEEERQQRPFVGTSGFILDQALAQVGIARNECYVTNVFNLRPRPRNDVSNLCGGKAEGIPGLPFLQRGKYVKKEYAPELERLFDEIIAEQPNVIVALGATAAWALLRSSGIKAFRGATTATCSPVSQRLGREFKVLPTFHPAAVARQWTDRPIFLSDLDKARGEAAFPEVRRPSRKLWLEPTLADLESYEHEYIIPADTLSIDIETRGDQITCIGFAPSTDSAITIPFWHSRGNYWPDLATELKAWSYVRRWCAMHPSVFQNGLYDIHFLWRRYGITCTLAEHDTMLLHHAQQLEMQKGLGFLATLYTNEASWKFMARSGTNKKED